MLAIGRKVFSQLPYSAVAIFKDKLDESSKEEHGQLAIVANVPSVSFLLQSLHSIARIIYEATEEADKNMIPQIERELFKKYEKRIYCPFLVKGIKKRQEALFLPSRSEVTMLISDKHIEGTYND